MILPAFDAALIASSLIAPSCDTTFEKPTIAKPNERNCDANNDKSFSPVKNCTTPPVPRIDF